MDEQSSLSYIFNGLGQLALAGDYGICVAVTLFLYDYIITFQDEQYLVWKPRWTYAKALFLFIRYTGFLVITGFLYVEFGQPVTYLSCSVFMDLLLSSVCVILLCNALILALRTWAIWDRSRLVGLILLIAWAGLSVFVVVFLVFTILELLPYGNQVFPVIPGCGPVSVSPHADASVKLWMTVVVYESIIFLLTMARGLRYIYRPCPLILILYRDAFLASISRLALTIVDAVLSSQYSDRFYLPFMLSIAFYFIIPCRIILNLRSVTKTVDEWDLATTQMGRSSTEITLRDIRWYRDEGV